MESPQKIKIQFDKLISDISLPSVLCLVSYMTFSDLLNLSNTSKKLQKIIKYRKIIKLYIREGYITQNERRLYYKYIINYNNLQKSIVNEVSEYNINTNENVYKNILIFCQKEISSHPSSPFAKSCEEINRDLDRTFSNDYFTNGNGRNQLKNVLIALSFLRPEIGYCQGMNFLAGTFIYFFKDDEFSFWIFLYLIDNYELSSLYLKNMPDYQIRLFQLNCFLQQYIPALYQHFYSHQIDLDIFFSKWIITLFSSYLPFQTLEKVLDVFLIDKWKSVFKFSMSFLHYIYEKIINMDLNAMTKYIREHSYNLHADYDKIKYAYKNFKITNKKIRELREDFFMEEVKNKIEVI